MLHVCMILLYFIVISLQSHIIHLVRTIDFKPLISTYTSSLESCFAYFILNTKIKKNKAVSALISIVDLQYLIYVAITSYE